MDADYVLATHHGPDFQLLRAIFHAGYIAHANRGASAVGDNNVSELVSTRDPAHGPQTDILRSVNQVPAWFLDIFIHQSVTQLCHAQIVSRQPLGIDQHADFASLTADQAHFSNAIHSLNSPPHNLVGDFREIAPPPRPGNHDGENGIGIRINLGNNRWQDVGGKILERPRDLFPHVLSSTLNVAFQLEGAIQVCRALLHSDIQFIQTAYR